MADKLHFELVSPERLLMSADADMVTVPGAEGDFGVMAGHAPFMTTLRPGVVDVQDGREETRLFVRGGFAEVNAEGLTLLAEHSVPLDELDSAALDQEIQNAQEDVDDAASDAARSRAEVKLNHLKQLRDAL
ncbi:ATP synthase epsilon chain [Candidatus Phaeomarinobacter ectocarpi]|uniref:ATP synthase epsilon chain n=1 Tax=Candidatus Phaeomarinibacter ectocarpi TaxID=1458461 RepID=X5M863_9HYPH|nr:F0F1 ATP synthase subunit epsilon [Candidatus Phaeomarinobacter ectocarpi]CDO59458.1 ATP synthase epsilon chain [Candidatus Phaeomarinobacter ectocarpi]